MDKPGHGHVGTFGYFTAICFTINYIMGCGFLSIPYAFNKAGIVLGPLAVGIITILCNITKDYLLESLARLEAYIRVTKDEARSDGVISRRLVESDFQITQRKFEITDALEALLGARWKRVYVSCLCIFLYGALWAYTAVFASSLAANIPTALHNGGTCDTEDGNCWAPYRVFLIVFAVIVVPLSCMDLEEQISVQVFMSAARVVVVLLMTFTIIGAVSCDGVVFDIKDKNPVHYPLKFKSTGSFRNGLSVLIPTAVYASIFHHSVPVLSQSVRDKSRLRSIFFVAFMITSAFYVAIGIVISLYFGERVDSQCNLNWKEYVGCASKDRLPHIPVSGWARFVRIVVLIFPALDVMSAFPLNAVTLGNNLMVAFLGHESAVPLKPGETFWTMMFGPNCRRARRDNRASGSAASWEEDGDSLLAYEAGARGDPSASLNGAVGVRERRALFRKKIMFRLLAACPPLVGALFVSNLGKILDYSGLVAILIAFVAPCAIRYFSRKVCFEAIKAADDNSSVAKGSPSKSDERMVATQYSAFYSTDGIMGVIFAIGIALFLYVLVENIKTEAG